MNKQPYPLSPLDHLSPHVHVPKLLYFSSNSTPQAVIQTLQDSLSKTISAFPILSASVGPSQALNCQKGSLAVQAPYFSVNDILSVKDLSSKYDFQSIQANEFPTDAVDGDVLPDFVRNNAKVFLAQANIIRGGIILVCAVHHCVMDEAGIFNVLKLWSTFCHGGNGHELVTEEWIDNSALLQGEGTGRLEDYPEYKLLPEDLSSTPYVSTSSDVAGTGVFFFSDDSLRRLKELANEGSNDLSWVSTNDALVALIWSRITSARLATSNSVDLYTPSLLVMTVNGRNRIQPAMSPTFTGNVVLISKSISTFSDLISSSSNTTKIGAIARIVRQSVRDVDEARVRDVIKVIQKVSDLNRLEPSGYQSYQRNVGCSSWSGQPYYGLDWGNNLGGKCKRFRWRSLKTDGVFVIFPRIPAVEGEQAEEGGLEICMGLRRECLQALREDKVFGQFAEWRCA
ncbi:hypothetical protein BCIN_15g04760 [Botrytis cinerea B05.10]|uniref:Trichothecene 3-O-acetyltransferase n=3 Tax=Botryotinia fuckeliana TaxID=40559 RepID=A0A384K5A1_BOTFB|nr:hypothetical protein BCIN_15g04760 [Botrytis cinerea B05.10]ATZ57978.1 hypothetical protein BCIN_15g04760 [Botrytis cinerea B05.10]EMR91194.1 putative trichothecene 3-o-acetyltransferase protein [Botrytis cinerea BcDW1]CCD34216.1 similar to trichothecene 3-O-acetyltransferase [Botrytis cinerea T4]